MSKDSDVGIVLSGGGTRGIAHVGVLRALAERGIHHRVVAGASAGAIVGALYGAGYSPFEMHQFFEKKNPFQLSKPALNKPGFIDTAKVVSDFEEYFPEDSFESLHKELRIVATDITTGEPIVFDSGPLILAVLASSSVPLVFTPTEIDGRWFSDGGIVNNFPVELLDGRCGVTIGVYVSPIQAVSQSDLTNSFSVFKRSLEIGMFHASKLKFASCDVMIFPQSLSRFSSFDTKHLQTIETIGYDAAVGQMESIELAVAGG